MLKGSVIEGGNEINVRIINGSWLKFNPIKLEGLEQF
jgi:hypothetical protein